MQYYQVASADWPCSSAALLAALCTLHCVYFGSSSLSVFGSSLKDYTVPLKPLSFVDLLHRN